MNSQFNYTIKAHPTKYRDVLFRSRLEARYAAFFDLMRFDEEGFLNNLHDHVTFHGCYRGFDWEYEPIDLEGWSPDFRVSIPWWPRVDGVSDMVDLLIEVKPYSSIEEFKGHPCLRYPNGVSSDGKRIPAMASAAFGITPHVSFWISTLPGWKSEFCLGCFFQKHEIDRMWKLAGNKTQWHPNR